MQLDVPVHRAAESSCSAHAPSMKTEWLQSLRGAPQGAPCTQTGTDIEFDV